MIVSDTIELKINLPISNSEIEDELRKLNIDVIRWAISEINDKSVKLQISYIK